MNDEQMEQRPLIRYEAAAIMLEISPVTLRKWVMEGRVPAKKIGKRLVRFDVQELREWVNAQSINVSNRGTTS